jgi:alkylmercury lyase
VDRIFGKHGIDRAEAERFLRQVTERDGDDNVVGALVLSHKQHPHRFTVSGIQMTAWCAQDTLFLPVMLQRTATVESESPLSKEKIRMTVGPEGVQEVSPPGAVMSMVIVDPDTTALNTPKEIQMAFCRMIHFFVSPQEVEEWVAGRDEVVSDSGWKFDLGVAPSRNGHSIMRRGQGKARLVRDRGSASHRPGAW